jgi:hypothetical protein
MDLKLLNSYYIPGVHEAFLVGSARDADDGL